MQIYAMAFKIVFYWFWENPQNGKEKIYMNTLIIFRRFMCGSVYLKALCYYYKTIYIGLFYFSGKKIRREDGHCLNKRKFFIYFLFYLFFSEQLANWFFRYVQRRLGFFFGGIWWIDQ